MITDIQQYEELKKKLNLSDQDVIQGAGVHANFFYRWRNGTNPRIDMLKKITDYLESKKND